MTCGTCGCPDVRWLRVKTVAKVLRCCERTVCRMLKRGELGGLRVQRQWRVDHQGLHRLIEAHSVDYTPEDTGEVT